MRTKLWLVVAVSLFGCGKHYPHDPVPCTSDSDCATGNKCLPEWTRPDGGGCLSTSKVCQKPCASDADCSFCGLFSACAVESCDTTGPKACSTFCGDGK